MDFPYEIVYEVMSPPATREEKAWDKSLKHYERLSTITDVSIIYLRLYRY